MKALRQDWRKLIFRIRSLPLREQLIIAGFFVGVAAGLSAYVFERLLDLFTGLCAPALQEFPEPWRVILVVSFPALGAIISGILTHRYCREAKGAGVENVVVAIQENAGQIPGRVAWVTTVASAATIGMGGSAGSEGPIVQIGGAVGSWISRTLDVSQETMGMMVAGGAAGGLAAVFSVPLAAVFFIMEVILKDFAKEAFSAVVISSVTATITARAFLGNESFFTPVNYQVASYYDYVWYGLLGLVCAPIGIWYRAGVHSLTHTFDREKRLPDWVHPAVGGFLVGALALALPEVEGTGKSVVSSIVLGKDLGWKVFALVPGKMLATAVTLGSGGAGGALMPSVYIGAMAGASYGKALHWATGALLPQGALAIVGIASVFSAAFGAPITAIVMSFEISQDYGIILPVMLACVLSYLAVNRRHAPAPNLTKPGQQQR